MKNKIVELFNRPMHSIVGAAITIATAGFASNLLGVVRDRLLAGTFGAGSELDAYYAAFRIPDFLYALVIAGALSAGFIPLFLETRERSTEEAWRLVHTVITVCGGALLVLCGISYFFIPQFTAILTPGFSKETFDLTVFITRIMLISPFFLGISSIFSSMLQARKLFAATVLSPIVYNISIIAGIIFFSDVWGIWGATVGVVVGAALHLLVLIPSVVREGYSFVFLPAWRNPTFLQMMKLMIPRTLALAAFQINFFVISSLATTLHTGSVAVFKFALNIQGIMVGLFGVSFALAAFPSFSESAAQKDRRGFVKKLSEVSRHVLYVAVPASFLLITLRTEIVRILLGTGNFNWSDTILTADTLAFLAIGLTGICLWHVLVRGFYAWQDTRTPLVAAVIGPCIGILVASPLMRAFPAWLHDPTVGIIGLAAASSVTSLVSTAFLWIMLRRKFRQENALLSFFSSLIHRFSITEKSILSSLSKMLVGSFLMIATVQGLKIFIAPMVDLQTFWGVFIRLVVPGIAGVLVYIGTTALLKSPEWVMIRESATQKWMKLKPGQELEG